MSYKDPEKEYIDVFPKKKEEKWVKRCSKCKKKQIYSTKGSLTRAIKKNTKCNSCSKVKKNLNKKYLKNNEPTEYQKKCKKNPEYLKKQKEYEKRYREKPKNKKKKKAYDKKYNQCPKRKKIKKKYQKKRRKTDPKFRLRHNISSALSTALKERGMSKQGKSTFDLIGFSKDILIKHLESLFTEGMNWDNYGEWVIDHIIPDIFFNYNDIVEFRICWRLENLKPMWKEKNREKSDKITLWGKEVNARFIEEQYFSKITY